MPNFLIASPHGEFLEIRETRMTARSNSPRREENKSQQRVVPPMQANERCCWAFLSCFANLMQYASDPSPYTGISQRYTR